MAESIPRETTAVDAETTTTATDEIPSTTTATAEKPSTTTSHKRSRPSTAADGPGPSRVARAFAAAFERQDWPEVCALYSRRSLAQLHTGAAGSGIEGDTCPKILRGVFGEGMALPSLDVSGEATVDGDRATVGEVTLIREDGEWKVEDGA